ncbi:MAG: MFS transporter [Bacillota bacterium]|nr:MFS transporter [Bacillota bacterium]
MNKKGLIGTFTFATSASALNMTSGILAYIMLTYSEVSSTNVALLLTIPAIVGTFYAFLSGNLINKFGIKKVALFTQFTAFLSGMIFLFLGNKTHIVVLYFASALFGFMLGGQAVILGQLLKECIPNDDKRAPFLGFGNSVVSLGGVVFATLGGFIAASSNGAHWEKAYLLYFWMLVCLLIEYLTLPNKKDDILETNKTVEKSKSHIPFKVWLISIHYFLFFLSLYAFSLNLSEYVITTHKLGTSAQSGLAISFLTIGGILSGLTFGVYSRFLKKKTMPVLFIICTIGLALVVFVPNIYILYGAAACLGFAMNGCNPYVLMELSRITSDEKSYAKAMSIYAGFMNAGMMFAVYILAFLSQTLFGDANSVMGKLTIALIGVILVAILSFPLYSIQKKS